MISYILYFLYCVVVGGSRSQNDYDARLPLRKHIKMMKKSGYTRKVFDCDGHVVTITSYKHKEDNSA